MYNNCGCNREFGFNDGCGYNRSEWNSGCGCNNDYYNDNAALYEAECVALLLCVVETEKTAVLVNSFAV